MVVFSKFVPKTCNLLMFFLTIILTIIIVIKMILLQSYLKFYYVEIKQTGRQEHKVKQIERVKKRRLRKVVVFSKFILKTCDLINFL
jgi:hypothetical protein